MEDLKKIILEDKLVTQTAYDILANEVFTAIKKKAEKSHTHQATDIVEDSTHKFVTEAEKKEWSAKVSTEQMQEAIKELASGLTWKGTYTNLQAVREALQHPEAGWTVITTEGKNQMYIYETDTTNDWQSLGNIFVPGEATGSSAGLMSASDKKKLDAINPSISLIQGGEREKWNKVEQKADKTIQIATGNGLQGGGDLSATRTLSVKAEDGSIIVGAGGIKANVVDGLGSSDAKAMLSANQGKVLKGQIDGKVDKTTAINTGNGLEGGGSINTGLTINVKLDGTTLQKSGSGLKVNAVNDLTTGGAGALLTAEQGKVLNNTKLDTKPLETIADLNMTPTKGIVLGKVEQGGSHRPTTKATTDTLGTITLAEDNAKYSQIAISQVDGTLYTRGSNGSVAVASWNSVVMGTKSDATNSSSSDTVATSKAVKDALTEAKGAISTALENRLSEEEARAIIGKYNK